MLSFSGTKFKMIQQEQNEASNKSGILVFLDFKAEIPALSQGDTICLFSLVKIQNDPTTQRLVVFKRNLKFVNSRNFRQNFEILAGSICLDSTAQDSE